LATTSMPESQEFDFSRAGEVVANPSAAWLIEEAIRNGEGLLASNGALVTRTGKFTGRTPKDKAIVEEPGCKANIWWENNPPFDPEEFEHLKSRVLDYVRGKKLYVIDAFGGADPEFRIGVRFVVEKAWHAQFVKTLLIRPSAGELRRFSADWTVVDVCNFQADPSRDGTRSGAFILLNFDQRLVLIGGTEYAGEMKKSVFTVLNYLLPLKGVMAMHCSANIGRDGDTALFFGLSGTGKTTLSADPDRRLIGDDEHGWSDKGVFNFEGGCYAKCIRLSKESEPQIWNAIRFGSVLENVVLREDRTPDYDDASITENTRCTYPVEFIEGAVIPSVGGHPKNICFLTADAFGVLPPISRLTDEQAMDQFLLGYTAKVAGTESGVTEPQVTFSTCFGAPFMPLRPAVYAKLLGERIRAHDAKVWLVNTGWTGGRYGVGKRMNLAWTRAMVKAALNGDLDHVEYAEHPIFGFAVPKTCPGVDAHVLNPKETWADKTAYDEQAHALKKMFDETIQKMR